MDCFADTVNAIKIFAEKFNQNPRNYLYESDIQFELMQCLKEQIPGNELMVDSHEISVVKSEYPGASKSNTNNRFDLVIIDPSASDAHVCNRPVSIAIELKLNIDPGRPTVGGLIGDLKKLSRFELGVITKAGFAILCIKPHGKDVLYPPTNGEAANVPGLKLINIDAETELLKKVPELKSINIDAEAELSKYNRFMGIYAAIIEKEQTSFFKLDVRFL